MATENKGSMKPVAVIIVGADALIAAQPATPIQLWHACLAAGYDLAVPATWGDELIAAECLRTLGSHAADVAVMCSCPMVARTLGEMPADLSPHLVSIVAPPVATARYVRRVYGERRVHITYVGACPAAADSAIDAWLAPSELLERFRATAIDLESQPDLFESILPPDRRRHLSLPGGLPIAGAVAATARPRRVHQVDDADLTAAIERHLASGVASLVDIAPRAGCACSGATLDTPASEARAAVMAIEPPRSARSVMADPGGLGLSRRLPVRTAGPAADRVRSATGAMAPSAAEAERDTPQPTAARAATRSPLSWHLRERALPQPPTTQHPAGRRTPAFARTVGASSSRWATSARTPDEPARPAADPITAAAVQALETAALAAQHSPPRSSRTEDAPGRAATPRDSRPARGTPPGGYWFAAPVVLGSPDTEVHRPSAPVDAVPDDVAPQQSPDAAEAGEERDGVVPGTDPDTLAEGENRAEPDTEAAELAELFRRNEAMEGVPVEPEANVAVPEVRDARPTAMARAAAIHPGPVPWKWLLGAALLMMTAIFIARRINERVTSEDAGTSAHPTSVGAPQSAPAPFAPRVPTSADASDSVVRDPRAVAPLGTPVSAPRRTTSPRRGVTPVTPVSARTDSLVVVPVMPPTDSIRPAGIPAVAPPALGSSPSALGMPPAAREIELQAIRDEIARRSARLDSMGRAIGSLYVAPRTPPPPPASPPPQRPH